MKYWFMRKDQKTFRAHNVRVYNTFDPCFDPAIPAPRFHGRRSDSGASALTLNNVALRILLLTGGAETGSYSSVVTASVLSLRPRTSR